jgi:hypothetical protein
MKSTKKRDEMNKSLMICQFCIFVLSAKLKGASTAVKHAAQKTMAIHKNSFFDKCCLLII